ncbi:MAG: SDR family NAD(P)-dependent oxidoreductase [Gammaproteobacteria bacterium]|nr:SDR family NAD(P)-dependent oxidoreductase [Gammaproteobacteria bacterium]
MRRALVTGGSGDIGSAISISLAAAGYHVYVYANKNIVQSEYVVNRILEQGGSDEAVQFDVCNQNETQVVLEKILDTSL